MNEPTPEDHALNALDMIGAALMFLTAIILAVLGLFIVVPIVEVYADFNHTLPMLTRVVVNRVFPLGSSVAILVMAMGCLFAPAPIQRRRIAIMLTFVIGLLLLFVFLYASYLPFVQLAGAIQ